MLSQEYGPEDSTNVLDQLDQLDRTLAGDTPRHGCCYKPVEQQCHHCRPLFACRAAIIKLFKARARKRLIWWEWEMERRGEPYEPAYYELNDEDHGDI